MPYDCFISYASTDKAIARQIDEILRAEGFNVWLDQTRLQAGCDWHADIRQYCEDSRIVLPVLTPRWKESNWTRFETYGAEAVVPLLCEGELKDVMTPPLERFQAEAFDVENLDHDTTEALFSALRRILAKPTPAERERLVHLRYRVNDNFVGRDRDLIRLHEELHRKPDVGLTQGRVRAITAMGGIGKTSLARQYAEKFWRCYPQMFWVDCRKGLNSEFATVHDLLFPDRADIGLSRDDKASRALSELQTDATRLLIIDNAEDEKSMSDWIPKTGSCHTLITTRYSGWSSAVKTLQLSELPHSVSVEFLQRRVGRSVLGEELAACNNIGDRLDGLPLALETAAAFISKSKLSFQKYLEYYDASAVKLLSLKALGSTEYQDAVITSLQLSLDRLTPGARAILQIASIVATTPIHEVQLTADPAAFFDRAQQLADPIALPDQPIPALWILEEVVMLADYSLANFEEGYLSLHPLMLTVQFETQTSDDRRLNWNVAKRMLLSSAPLPAWKTDSREHWTVESAKQWERMAPHMDRMLSVRDQISGLVDDLEFQLLAVHTYASQGLFDRAISLCENLSRQLHTSKPVSKKFQIEVKDCLACLLLQNGSNADALLAFESLTKLQTELEGENHRGTLRALHNQACCMELLDLTESAEQLLYDVSERRKKHLGEDHYDTIVSIHDTGWLLRRRSVRLDEAEECLKQALDRWTATLGAASPDSRDAATNYAYLLRDSKRYTEAVAIQQKLLNGVRDAMGHNHLECFSIMHNLALFEFNARLHDKAHDHISRVVAGYRNFLPPNHRDMLTAIQDLGTICVSQKDFESAERLLLEALAGYEESGDSDPKDLMRTVTNIAALYDSMGRPDDAMPYHKRHADFVSQKENADPLELRECAHTYFKMGDHELAERLLIQILSDGFEIPGTCCHLARILIVRNRIEEARNYVNRAWAARSKDCPTYVKSRILFLQILFAYIERARPAAILKRLRTHMNDPSAHNGWDIAEVLDRVKLMLDPDDFVFVKALAGAIQGPDEKNDLDSFSDWPRLAANVEDDSPSTPNGRAH